MDIAGLYGKSANAENAIKRFEELKNEHRKIFGTGAESVFSTPGRTELGGNHTDHNLGKVLAGSINLDAIAAVHKSGDNTVTFVSEGYEPLNIDISKPEVDEKIFGTTEALIKGVAASVLKRGGNVGGFKANVSSNVFKGSGLSSSAAIEVLAGTIFNSLFNDMRFSTTEIAIMGKEAENIYFGKPSGLMDQLACAYGGIIGIDFQKPDNPTITPVAVDFSDFGYNLVITTTGGNHADLTSDYASIPAEMKAVAGFFGKKFLREVQENEFLEHLREIRNTLKNDRAMLRAMHYFKENDRVGKMILALQEKDFVTYLGLVNESGDSSFKFLQNIYSPNAASEQGISLAIAMTQSFLGSRGACRIQGGGFAGTIEAYVPIDETEKYFKHMERLFGEGCCTILSIRNLPAMRVW